MTMLTPGGLNADGHPMDATHLENLRQSFRGELIQSGHAGYDAARRVWNGNIDRRPALIARCTGVADVQRAVDVRSPARSPSLGARRRPQCTRLRDQRRRPRD